ncbi:hypothetical protein, partial [Eubacterium ramulus]|uniref:hypothetical protein n=1 Tax=Eubacterium ramulus TaxID=39490 RepID=UPI002FD838EE
MEYDLNGGDKTGFNPYIKEGQICFDHRWLLLIGKKENQSPFIKKKKLSVCRTDPKELEGALFPFL